MLFYIIDINEVFILMSLCLLGSEAFTKDSLWEDHEAHPEEGCHGDHR